MVGSTCSENSGPQDMEIDHVGTVQSSLSSRTCQTKAVVTEVESEHKKPVETLEGKREISCIPHVSTAENVSKNMRRECQVKSFDGLGVLDNFRPNSPSFHRFVLQIKQTVGVLNDGLARGKNEVVNDRYGHVDTLSVISHVLSGTNVWTNVRM